MRQAGLFGLSDHLKRLSAHGDPLEELGRIIEFEAFRPVLVSARAYGDRTKGGRPPYDAVAMLKVLVLAAQNDVADSRMEYLIPRPAELAALPRLRSWRTDARCQHDPAISREADRGGCARRGVHGLRPAAQGARLSRYGWSDRRCHTGGCSQAAQYRA